MNLFRATAAIIAWIPFVDIQPVHAFGESISPALQQMERLGRGIVAVPPENGTGKAICDGLRSLWNARGEVILERKPRSCNFCIGWDADPLRELLDRNIISKWNWIDGTKTSLLTAEGCTANNGTKSTPALCADILGDWREEVIFRKTDNRALRIYTTVIPSTNRLVTLMHDANYRLSVAIENVGYNQPAQPGFHLGADMKTPPRSNIITTSSSAKT